MIEELTNKNFRSVIGQPNRSVLVKYYHPKCAACRPAGQAFRDSAQAFSGRRDQLAFCAMDVSANACPAGIYVPGTPYIQLYIRGDTRRRTYLGELDSNEINRFIEAEIGLTTSDSAAANLVANAGVNAVANAAAPST
uniref:Thioredoxin domain-containing protein n=2 Tax=Macrostomum lignano TaxID=282301 RepID=A0A1I8IG60_9PLAT